jgi:hypothetical protein
VIIFLSFSSSFRLTCSFSLQISNVPLAGKCPEEAGPLLPLCECRPPRPSESHPRSHPCLGCCYYPWRLSRCLGPVNSFFIFFYVVATKLECICAIALTTGRLD